MLSIPAVLQASYEAYLRAGEIPETVHRELRGHPFLLRTNQSLRHE
jgi:hypothetical protein